MFHNTTGKPIYVNQDKSRVVEEDSGDAAFLLVGPDGTLPEDEARKYGLRARAMPAPDPVAEAQQALDGAVERGALEEARSHRNRLEDLKLQEEARKAAARKASRAEADEEPKAAAAEQPKASEPKMAAPAENKGR